MSTKDFIKKSVLNAFTQYDAPKLAVALLAALAPVSYTHLAQTPPTRPSWPCGWPRCSTWTLTRSRAGTSSAASTCLLYTSKVLRGVYAASYSLLCDATAYPVINGAVFYLDDFPSPVPGGDGTYIRRDYSMSTADFYSKVWWPDLMKLSQKYSIRFTGVMIENYEDDTVAVSYTHLACFYFCGRYTRHHKSTESHSVRPL